MVEDDVLTPSTTTFVSTSAYVEARVRSWRGAGRGRISRDCGGEMGGREKCNSVGEVAGEVSWVEGRRKERDEVDEDWEEVGETGGDEWMGGRGIEW